MKIKNLILGLGVINFISNAQIAIPSLSPSATVIQQIGVIEAKVEYSRPSLRGRKVFGEVVKFNEAWRTGANSTTKISFSDTVIIAGKKIAPATYALYTIPRLDNWTIVLSKNAWAYAWDQKESDDAVRLTVKPEMVSPLVETFTIGFANLTKTNADLTMTWENMAVKFTIVTDADKKVMADIDNKVNSFDTYWAAANYYFDNNKDINKALEWSKIASAKNPQFWNVSLIAKIQSKMGDCASAVETAKKAIELAKAANNEDNVKSNQKLIAECPVVVTPSKKKK